MHISDKLKSSIGLVLSVLLVGSIAGNYIESQKPQVTTITYAELVERTSSRNAESDTSEAQADETSESEDESVPPEAQPDLTTASTDESSLHEAEPDALVSSEAESIPSEAQSYAASESVPSSAQTDVTAASQAPVTQSVATTIIPAENSNDVPDSDEANQLTVYVSSTGKYHKKCDCSGMKNYTEMTLQQAIEAGHTACKRCW